MGALAKLAPWLLGVLRTFGVWFLKTARLKEIWTMVATMFGIQIARQVAKLPLRVAILVAWAVFLAAVFSAYSGIGLTSIFTANPLTGVPATVMYFVCSVFPLKFFFTLVFSYIIFRTSLMVAVKVLNESLLFVFGP